MIAETKFFGSVEADSKDIIDFPHGIPGFEQDTQFLCIEQAHLRPLVFLQSVTDPSICFLTLPVRVIEPSYEVDIEKRDAAALGLHDGFGVADVLCLAIVSTADRGGPTANLFSPVVINIESRTGMQIVQSQSQHDCFHPIAVAAEHEAVCS